MGDGLLGLVESLGLAALTTHLFQVVEVALLDGCDIGATEDTNLKIDRFLLAILDGNFSAGTLEVI